MVDMLAGRKVNALAIDAGRLFSEGRTAFGRLAEHPTRPSGYSPLCDMCLKCLTGLFVCSKHLKCLTLL